MESHGSRVPVVTARELFFVITQFLSELMVHAKTKFKDIFEHMN